MASQEFLDKYAQALEETRMQLSTLKDPTEQALARKAILQTDVLSYFEGDETFSKEKPLNFGILRVFPTIATLDWVSPSGEFEIGRGEIYLDFHLPKSDNISIRAANKGYVQIAEYMKTNPNIRYIMGVTYRIMAISARRNQGFNTEEIVLPEEVMNFATAYWQNMIPDAKSKQFQTAHIVWQSRETFIGKFGSYTDVILQ
ncbi:MAG TPA: hypothetical protein VMR76_00830 [Candidatus Saccharimonadia bacterium]|nr:hypothetical protein [Candidatus Saccharimonadia bacterium]